MCRSIKVLRKPGQTATAEELRSAALQYVRKISGFQKPSRANQEAFERAVLEIRDASERLLQAIGVSGRGGAEQVQTRVRSGREGAADQQVS